MVSRNYSYFKIIYQQLLYILRYHVTLTPKSRSFATRNWGYISWPWPILGQIFMHAKFMSRSPDIRLKFSSWKVAWYMSIDGIASIDYCPIQLVLQNAPTTSLQRSKTPPNECPGYDTKQSDSEAPVILELWGMLSTPSLPSLPGPH